MKKVAAFVACAFALAFGCFAADWFNGGIGTDWPADSAMKGGAWATSDVGVQPAELGEIVDSALSIEATLADLQFKAAKGRDSASDAGIAVTSALTFEAFDAASLPEIPEGAKGAICIGTTTSGDTTTAQYFGVAKVGDANAWVPLAGVTPSLPSAEVQVTILFKTVGDVSTVSYKIGDTLLTYGDKSALGIIAEDTTVTLAGFSGVGRISSLSAVSALVEATVPAVEHATVAVTAGGNVVTPDSNGVYLIPEAVAVNVTYTAAEGYALSGTSSFDFAAGAPVVISAENLPSAETAAAKIGDVFYISLNAAIDAATAGQTITLLGDVTLTETLSINKNIAIDLNGKTITSTLASVAWAIRLGDTAAMTAVVSNGTIVANQYGVRVNQTALTLEDVTINSTLRALQSTTASDVDLVGCTISAAPNAEDEIAILTKGGKLDLVDTVVISGAKGLDLGGTVATIDADSSVVVGGKNCAVFVGSEAGVKTQLTVAGTVEATASHTSENDSIFAISGNGTDSVGADVTIVDGAVVGVTAAETAIYWPNAGTLTVNGGSITGGTAIWAKSGNVVINGGAISAIGDPVAYLEDNDGVTPTGDAIVLEKLSGEATGYSDNLTASITGGTVTSANGAAILSVAREGETELAGFVSGGKFSSAISEALCANGFIPKDNGDGTYGVKEGAYVAKIGEAKYETIADAITAAAANDTVTLLDNVALTETLSINKNIAIDLNGKTITSTLASVGWAIRLGDTAAMTAVVSNGTIVANQYGVRANQTALTLENVTVTSTLRALQSTTASDIDLVGCTISAAPGAEDEIAILTKGGTLDLVDTDVTSGAKGLDLGGTVATIDADSSVVVGGKNCAVFVGSEAGVKTQLTVAGTVRATASHTSDDDSIFAISGNGTDSVGADVTIADGAVVSVTADETAIYWPNAGTLTVNGGSITGGTAIWAKSGNVVINGGAISATGDAVAYAEDNDGVTPTGDAIVLEKLSGEATGYSDNLTASITGGTVTSANGAAILSVARKGETELAGFVSGGTFSSAIPEALCANGFIPVDDGEGHYGVTPGFVITYVTEYADAPATRLVEATEGVYTLTAEDLPALAYAGYDFGGWGKAVGETISADTVLTAVWNVAHIPAVIDLQTAVAEAGTNYNGSTVSVSLGEDYTPGDDTVTAKLTIGSDVYDGVIADGVATFEVGADKAVAGQAYNGTIAVLVNGEEADTTSVALVQGRLSGGVTDGWIDERAAEGQFNRADEWKDTDGYSVPTLIDGKLEFSDKAYFAATNASAPQAVVSVTTAVAFDAPNDEDSTDIGGGQAAFKVVTNPDTADGAPAYVFAVWCKVGDAGAFKTTSVAAALDVEYAVTTVIDYAAGTVSYSFGGEAGTVVETLAPSEKVCVAGVEFLGAGRLGVLEGEYDAVSVNATLVADADGVEYATVAEAIAGGRPPLTALYGKIALPEGWILDGTTLVPEDPEAKIGTVLYLTLNDALDAAANGDTVTLLKSVTDADGIAVATGVTLDLGQFYVFADDAKTTPAPIDASLGTVVLHTAEQAMLLKDSTGEYRFAETVTIKNGDDVVYVFPAGTVMNVFSGETGASVAVSCTDGTIVDNFGAAAEKVLTVTTPCELAGAIFAGGDRSAKILATGALTVAGDLAIGTVEKDGAGDAMLKVAATGTFAIADGATVTLSERGSLVLPRQLTDAEKAKVAVPEGFELAESAEEGVYTYTVEVAAEPPSGVIFYLTEATRPGTDFTNVTVQAGFDYASLGTYEKGDVTATLTVGDKTYEGTITWDDAGQKAVVDFGVIDTEAGSITSGTVALKVKDEAFEGGSAAETIVAAQKLSWITETIASHGQTGVWSEGSSWGDNGVSVSDGSFVPAKPSAGDLVEVVSKMTFQGETDVTGMDLTGLKAGIILVKAEGWTEDAPKYQFSVLNNAATWNLIPVSTIDPAADTEYAVKVVLNYKNSQVQYSIVNANGSETLLGAFANGDVMTNAVTEVVYKGSGVVSELTGDYWSDDVAVDAAGVAYKNLADAVANGTRPIKVIYRDVTVPEGWTIVETADGYELQPADPEARIGTVFYVTLNDAIEASQKGDVIALCKDVYTGDAEVVLKTGTKLDIGTYCIASTVEKFMDCIRKSTTVVIHAAPVTSLGAPAADLILANDIYGVYEFAEEITAGGVTFPAGTVFSFDCVAEVGYPTAVSVVLPAAGEGEDPTVLVYNAAVEPEKIISVTGGDVALGGDVKAGGRADTMLSVADTLTVSDSIVIGAGADPADGTKATVAAGTLEVADGKTVTLTPNAFVTVGAQIADAATVLAAPAGYAVSEAAPESDDMPYVYTATACVYTVTYELDGGTVDGTNPETYTIESEGFTLVNPTKDGWRFLGWTGTGLEAATETVTVAKGSTGDKTFTATWEFVVEPPEGVIFYLTDATKPGVDFTNVTVQAGFDYASLGTYEKGDVTATLTVGDKTYTGTITWNETDRKATVDFGTIDTAAGSVTGGTIALKVKDEAFEGGSATETIVAAQKLSWITESSETFGQTGTWSEGTTAAAGGIEIDNSVFTPKTSSNGDLVELVLQLKFAGAVDIGALDVEGVKAGAALVEAEGSGDDDPTYNLAVLANGEWKTIPTETLAASPDTEYTVKVLLNYAAKTVTYSLVGEGGAETLLGSWGDAAVLTSAVASIDFYGSGTLARLDGDFWSAAIAQNPDGTLANSVAAAADGAKLLWDATYTPTKYAKLGLDTNGHELIVPDGWYVRSGEDGLRFNDVETEATVVKAGGAGTDYMFFDEAFAAAEAGDTVRLVADVTVPGETAVQTTAADITLDLAGKSVVGALTEDEVPQIGTVLAAAGIVTVTNSSETASKVEGQLEVAVTGGGFRIYGGLFSDEILPEYVPAGYYATTASVGDVDWYTVAKSVSIKGFIFSIADAGAYDGTEKTPAVTMKETADGEAIAADAGYAVTYEANVNAGVATATVTGTGRYTDSTNLTFAIAKAAVTVTPDADQQKKVGESDPDLTYKVTAGQLYGGDAFTGALARAEGDTAGTYEINVGTLTAGDNYEVTFVSGVMFTIVGADADLVGSDGATINGYEETAGSGIKQVRFTALDLATGKVGLHAGSIALAKDTTASTGFVLVCKASLTAKTTFTVPATLTLVAESETDGIFTIGASALEKLRADHPTQAFVVGIAAAEAEE